MAMTAAVGQGAPVGRLPEASMPPFEAIELTNGVRVALLPRGRLPLVHLLCKVPIGGQDDAPGLEGSAAVLLPMMRGRSEMSAWADWESGIVALEALEPEAENALQRLAAAVFNPEFSAQSLAAIRGRHLATLRRRSWHAAGLADDWFSRRLFEHRPYGRPLIGGKESLERLGLAHLRARHREAVAPQTVDFIAIGRFPRQRLLEGLAALPPGGEAARPPAEPPPGPPSRPRFEVLLVDSPSTRQSELRIGHPGLSRRHPEFHRLRLLCQILTARLMEDLRETRALTYHVESVLAPRRGAGPFYIRAAVPHESCGEAVQRIRGHLRRLREQRVTESELLGAKHRFIGGFLRSIETGRQLAIRVKQLAFSRLGHDFFDRQLEDVRAVDTEALRRTARRHLDGDRALAVVVGPRRQLETQFDPAALELAEGPDQ